MKEQVLKILLHEDVKQHADNYVDKWAHTFSNDFDNGDADDQMKRVGFYCEFAIKKLYGIPLPKLEEGGKGDGGHDITINGITVDIKGQRCNYDYKTTWGNNVRDKQLQYGCSKYLLFAHYNQQNGIISIPGYMLKSMVKVVADVVHKGDVVHTAKFRNTTYVVYDKDINRLNLDKLVNKEDVVHPLNHL